MTFRLIERNSIQVGPAPVQLVAADGGRYVAALSSGNARSGWGSCVTIFDGASAEVRAVVDTGPAPWNATARGHLLCVAMHTEPPADCVCAVPIVDLQRGEVVARISLPGDARPVMLAGGGADARIHAPGWGNGGLYELDNRLLWSIDVHWILV